MQLKNIPSYSPQLFQVVREEEKMRHVVTLVRELEAHPSCPHGIIWFNEIKTNQLVYEVLLVRQKNGECIDQILEKVDPTLHFTPERLQFFGEIEVAYFTLKMEITPEYLYSDLRVHPTRPRQKIVRVLEKGLGVFRDYYGGLLQKKEEALCKLKSSFHQIDEEFVEAFFYSIHPQKMQATLSEEVLESFFSYFLFCFNEKQRDFSHNQHGCFAYLRSNQFDPLASLKREFYRKGIDLHSFTSVVFMREGSTHFCLFFPFLSS